MEFTAFDNMAWIMKNENQIRGHEQSRFKNLADHNRDKERVTDKPLLVYAKKEEDKMLSPAKVIFLICDKIEEYINETGYFVFS